MKFQKGVQTPEKGNAVQIAFALLTEDRIIKLDDESTLQQFLTTRGPAKTVGQGYLISGIIKTTQVC